MQSRFGRAAIAATLLGTLLVPAVGSFADSHGELTERKERIDDRLGRVRNWIEIHETQAGALRAEIKSLDQQIISLRNEVTQLQVEIARAESEVRTVQARIDETQAKIDAIQAVATEQAVTLYKAGSTEALDALLDSKDLGELDARVAFLGVAASENTGALIRFGRLRASIQVDYDELFAAKQVLVARQNALQKAKEGLDQRYEQQKAAYMKLEAQLDEAHEDERGLAAASLEIEQDILEASTLASVAVLGKSAEGFIWPVNGGITSYYGPRWGRMHTGIDIDCNTGDPLVASKAGRVILATYYSGYGNAVAIDHGGGISTLYGHMTTIGVSNGQDVAQGAIIGTCGSTGNSTGSHVHFEVRVNGSPVDPLPYLP
ncbi:MAG: peptidoglycan DD-metalloendopeptidase family protein [Actinomycetota bacterium]|nr:peptidoglycan DD-metalloendopeptidase family protein [Actinomycetota bacterium]